MEGNKDLVYLVWTDYKTGKKFKIGELYKEDGTYYFKYLKENVKEAMKYDFSLLTAFPQINATYDNPKLFACFGARLPEKTRPDLQKILDKYGMKEYNEWELLKRNGAKLPTDHYEFVRN